MVLRVGTDFSGIEAPIQALEQLGVPFEHIWSCEIDKFCRQSIEANYKPLVMYHDITQRNHSELPDIDLYVAGFPCQAFSSMGNKGGLSDPRGLLMTHRIKVIQLKKPPVFILENVKNFLHMDNGKIFQHLLKELEKSGDYYIDYHIYNTKDYGIPQNRERLYIVGILSEILTDSFKRPEKIPVEPLVNFIEDKTINTNFKPCNTVLSNLKKLEQITNQIGIVTGSKITTVKIGYSPTITTNCNTFFINTYNRYLTIKELLALQGFSKDFHVVVSKTQMCKQIGNSMSVNVLKVILKEIFTCSLLKAWCYV